MSGFLTEVVSSIGTFLSGIAQALVDCFDTLFMTSGSNPTLTNFALYLAIMLGVGVAYWVIRKITRRIGA